MPKTIKLLPSGRTFISEGHSTLLEAGLQSGLALDYGCSNGNCGKCLARVVSGEVETVHHHDFALSEQQRLNHYVLMCACKPVTDVTLEATEADDNVQIPMQQIIARVRHLEIVNHNVALLHLKTPRMQRLRFLAGQKVQLSASGIGSAEYAIGSCPCDDMNLHFQIPRTGSAFSQYVFNDLKRGDHIEINGPSGDFLLNEASTKPLIFIARHTGFAGIKSLIEQAMALELSQDMHLVWMAASPQDRYQHNLCRSWRDAFDNFHYVPLDSSTPDAEQVFESLGIGWSELAAYEIYVAGEEGLIEAIRKVAPDLSLHVQAGDIGEPEKNGRC